LGALLFLPVQASAQTQSTAEQPDDVLDRPVHGKAALAALDNERTMLAERNDMNGSELEQLLKTDRTMWLDQAGRLFVKDPTPAVDAASGDPAPGPFPNDQTFQLHSRPGANRVIYLDFNGGQVSGTSWNDNFGVSTIAQPAFDLDGNQGSWSQTEIDTIQSVYQRVAEDYRPFDVDVTTEEPGSAAVNRDSVSDNQYGTRVMISPSAEMWADTCASSCGGIAYVGIFSNVGNAYHQPALVFPQALSWNDKYIAEATSHEAGHNLGLHHDGTSTLGYYQGHSNWAPIMGVGYDRPLVQWSQGEYPGANNAQDDLAVIQGSGLPLRPDDNGSTIASARFLGTAKRVTGVIENRDDRDVFAITRRCAGRATIAANPATRSPNLDIRLKLLNGSGTVLAKSDPASGMSSFDVATGLAASITDSLRARTYYVEVDGVGARDLATGYTGYASLGQYTLRVPGDGCA
jgi:hypothetical protein